MDFLKNQHDSKIHTNKMLHIRILATWLLYRLTSNGSSVGYVACIVISSLASHVTYSTPQSVHFCDPFRLFSAYYFWAMQSSNVGIYK